MLPNSCRCTFRDTAYDGRITIAVFPELISEFISEWRWRKAKGCLVLLHIFLVTVQYIAHSLLSCLRRFVCCCR